MNIEQLYEQRKLSPLFRPANYEGLYNVNKTRKWCIKQDTLYYIKNCGGCVYHLWSADLENDGAKKIVLAFSTPLQGEDFSVLYAMNDIFIYRLISEGIEIFRWNVKEGTLTSYPRQVVHTKSRILGFDMKEIYCSEQGTDSYSIFALDIDSGSRREIYSAQKELGEVLVLRQDLIVYDYKYDDDSVSSPLTDYDFHLISKRNHYAPCSFDAYSYLVDADHELIWSIENEGPAQYLVPLSIMSISVGEKYDMRIASNAPVVKFSGNILYGDWRNFVFNGFTLLMGKHGILTAYEAVAQSGRVLSKNCYSFGKAGKYFYVNANGETKLYLQRTFNFSPRGSVEEIINK